MAIVVGQFYFKFMSYREVLVVFEEAHKDGRLYSCGLVVHNLRRHTTPTTASVLISLLVGSNPEPALLLENGVIGNFSQIAHRESISPGKSACRN